MSGEALTDLDLVEVAAAIRARELSSVEVTEACIAAAEASAARINAYVRLDAESALAEARAADARLGRGEEVGPLHGVPLAHKDLFFRAGKPITCASKVLNGFTADYDATVTARLASAGAVYLGGLNMAEVAVGAAGRNEHYGHCRNPWNPDYITGGSSSGSGAAVAARTCYGALGTDTGGSVRIPAAVCGVVGLKGTYGRVSRHGVMPLSYSLDNVGPMARTVADCARLFGIIAGPDPADPLTASEPVPDYEALLQGVSLQGLRIGVPTQYYYAHAAPSVRAALDASLQVLVDLGAEAVETPVPDHDALRDLCNILLKSEAAGIHAEWLRERPEAYSREVRTRLLGGLFVPAPRYLQALRVRNAMVREFCDTVFSHCDVLHAPGLAIEVPTLAATDAAAGEDALRLNEQLAWCTRPLNYLGLPGLCVPCGFSDNGLPVSMQLIGRPFDEDRLLQVGHAYQQATDWHRRRPPGSA